MTSIISSWAGYHQHGPRAAAEAEEYITVPKTVAMMRQETSLFQARNGSKKTSKKKSIWRHGHKHGGSSTSSASSTGSASSSSSNKQKTKKKLSLPSTIKENNRVSKLELQEEIDQKRRLWRVYRRKLHREQQTAVLDERRRLTKADAAIQAAEQEEEFRRVIGDDAEALFVVDVQEEERPMYELVLPRVFMKRTYENLDGDDDSVTKSEKGGHGGWNMIEGGFWELLNMITGKSCKDDMDADTASTSDETSMASMASEQTMESEASWQSWNSIETEKMDNCGRNRELIMKHFGGENDSPWLAAKRGDLNALEFRWKNRHDWTLEDEFGNVPLYYACKYGKNLRVVLFLLLQWPSTQHIPPSLISRCKDDAANIYVQEILTNPCHAEWIIFDYEENFPQGENDGVEHELLEDHAAGEAQLYDIYEGEEDEE